MPFDFYLSRLRRDDDGPDILRVDNCSEVDIAGNFYKQNGKYYDDCCDLENKNAPECIQNFDQNLDQKGKTENLSWLWHFALVGLILIALLLALVWWCLKRGWSSFKTWFEKYYIACRQCRQRHRPCCKRQRPVGNENSTRRFSRRLSTRLNVWNDETTNSKLRKLFYTFTRCWNLVIRFILLYPERLRIRKNKTASMSHGPLVPLPGNSAFINQKMR